MKKYIGQMVERAGSHNCSTYLGGWTKRFFDILACSLLLLPAIVVIGLASLNTLVCEGRPVFFVHWRVGKNGRPFRLFKLRTLSPDVDPYKAASGSEKALLATATGKLLRRYRLDELPQLFSVLTGRMSLIGPRPELPSVVASYRPISRRRLLAKPGVTGLWQIMGDRTIPMDKGVKYDLYYLRKASLWLDIRILMMTVAFVLSQR